MRNISIHCPKNNLNLWIKTEIVTVGADAIVYFWLISGHHDILYVYVKQSWVYGTPMHLLRLWQARFLCRYSDFFGERLGFYADIQIFFGKGLVFMQRFRLFLGKARFLCRYSDYFWERLGFYAEIQIIFGKGSVFMQTFRLFLGQSSRPREEKAWLAE